MKWIKSTFRTNSLARSLKEWLDDFLRVMDRSQSRSRILASYLARERVDCVIDAGANVGQFGVDIRRCGYKGAIHSFEPSKSSYERLLKVSDRDDLWSVHNFGLGAQEAFLPLHLTENAGLSSSIKEQLRRDDIPSAYVKTVGDEIVSIKRIDSLEYFEDFKRVFLKIDTQGYEYEVLLGAESMFPKITSALIETSFVETYLDHKTIDEIIKLMQSKNFSLADFFPHSYFDGIQVECDLYFLKRHSKH